MQKDFDTWNAKKKSVHNRTQIFFFREREIWWCFFGVNVGFEHDGKGEQSVRPVLILKKFSPDVFVGVPLSTTKKKGRYYFKFSFLGDESTALLSQLRLLDAKRLADKMGSIPEDVHEKIRQEVKAIL